MQPKEIIQKLKSSTSPDFGSDDVEQMRNLAVASAASNSVEFSNSATKLFLGDGSNSNPSCLEFKTWYQPNIFHYLLQLVPNHARYLRVIFPIEDNVEKFNEQLSQLIILGNSLNRPLLFISKEPGVDSHFICGLIRGNDLLLINPIGITKHQTFYDTIFKFKNANKLINVWLSNNTLQKLNYENGLFNCGPIILELAIHILSLNSEILETFWLEQLKTDKPVTHEQTSLIYYTVDINTILPQTLKTLCNASDEITYKTTACSIRKEHFVQLKDAPETSLITCLKGLPAQVLFNRLMTERLSIIQLESLPEYDDLKKELRQKSKEKASANFFEPQVSSVERQTAKPINQQKTTNVGIREISIIDDGNCAFNVFALAGLNVLVAGNFDKNLPAQKKWRQLLIKAKIVDKNSNWNEIKLILKNDFSHSESQLTLQKILQRFLRWEAAEKNLKLIENYVKQTLKAFVQTFQKYRNNESDNIFIKAPFIKAYFQQQLDLILNEEKTEEEVEATIRKWWETEGVEQFIEYTKENKVWVGDIELAALAQEYYLDIFVIQPDGRETSINQNSNEQSGFIKVFLKKQNAIHWICIDHVGGWLKIINWDQIILNLVKDLKDNSFDFTYEQKIEIEKLVEIEELQISEDARLILFETLILALEHPDKEFEFDSQSFKINNKAEALLPLIRVIPDSYSVHYCILKVIENQIKWISNNDLFKRIMIVTKNTFQNNDTVRNAALEVLSKIGIKLDLAQKEKIIDYFLDVIYSCKDERIERTAAYGLSKLIAVDISEAKRNDIILHLISMFRHNYATHKTILYTLSELWILLEQKNKFLDFIVSFLNHKNHYIRQGIARLFLKIDERLLSNENILFIAVHLMKKLKKDELKEDVTRFTLNALNKLFLCENSDEKIRLIIGRGIINQAIKEKNARTRIYLLQALDEFPWLDIIANNKNKRSRCLIRLLISKFTKDNNTYYCSIRLLEKVIKDERFSEFSEAILVCLKDHYAIHPKVSLLENDSVILIDGKNDEICTQDFDDDMALSLTEINTDFIEPTETKKEDVAFELADSIFHDRLSHSEIDVNLNKIIVIMNENENCWERQEAARELFIIHENYHQKINL